MRLQKFEHSCLLIEADGFRCLVDPGRFSSGLDGVERLTCILITHSHDDHLGIDQLQALLIKNPSATIICDELSSVILAGYDIPSRTVHVGEHLEIGASIDVFGGEHAIVHPDLPTLPNIGYRIAEEFSYAGDSFEMPNGVVDIVALPVAASWMKMAEAIDYVRLLRPRVIVPVHDFGGGFTDFTHYLLERLCPAGTIIKVLDATGLTDMSTAEFQPTARRSIL